MDSKALFLFLCSSVMSVSCIHGAKLLFAPLDLGYNSRVTNMLKLCNLMYKQGHDISVLWSELLQKHELYEMNEKNNLKMMEQYDIITYKTPVLNGTGNQNWLDDMIGLPMSQQNEPTRPVILSNLELTLKDQTAWKRLTEVKYDLIITDEYVFVTRILGAQFDIPVIAYINWGPFSIQGSLLAPINPSYIPIDLSQPYSDSMTFMERLWNTWEHIKLYKSSITTFGKAKEICLKYSRIIKPSACENLPDFYKTVSLILMNRHNVLHYPAPFMPHVISIADFFLDPPKQLDAYYNDIVENSGSHGVILVSFGSLFRRLSDTRAAMFARAFAAMPQTVIWSYDGDKPEGLGANTIIDKWIPQKDLMSHPNIKLVVHQCGMTSTFQTIHYAQPTVNIPFFLDQVYNCEKLANRVKSGELLRVEGLTSEILLKAMKNVISNATYKANAEKASKILSDNDMDPSDKAIYWIEYVLRHKGAHHLRSQGMNNLSFCQYYLLDIIGLVLLIVIFILYVVVSLVKFLGRKIWPYKQKRD
ncbi:unnamed protein product [Owenia fusiformis]|uniref:Uncharacterized protein n=1 Tax=Owenia fusiformis TaxID=6347 RepID=A0A8J1Y0C7_OWEFU|nr:unnamed protein product [Owenia fusiformis]